MITIKALTVMQMEDGNIIRVESTLCFYQVAVMPTEVHVRGPGLQVTYGIGVEGSPIPSDPDLSDEGKAALAVIYFEESNQ